MKIAYASYSSFPDGGAVVNRMHAISKGLASLGHETYLIFPLKSQSGPLLEDHEGVNICWGSNRKFESINSFILKIYKRLLLFFAVHKIMKNRLDWLILYNFDFDALIYIYLAKIYNTKIAIEINELRCVDKKAGFLSNYKMLFSRIAEIVMTRFAHIDIVSSTYLKMHLSTVASENNIIVLNALTDIIKYNNSNSDKRLAFRRKYNIGNEILISYLGSYHYTRGINVLLKAAHLLSTVVNNYKIMIGGKILNRGDYINVMNFIENHKLLDIIVLREWFGPEQLIEAYLGADVLVIPNIDHNKSRAAFPHKLAEYLSMGKAIVATRIGDIPIYLKDYDNALLCNPGDPYSMANALKRLIEDSSLRKKISYNARKTAIKQFDCRKVVKILENALIKK